MAERVYRPRWHCRLHLFHRWRMHRSDHGGGYSECLDCGKYGNVGVGLADVGGGGGADVPVG